MTLKTYPQYKAASLSWLEDIPSHWNVEKSKYLFTLAKRAVRKEDGIVTAFRDGMVTLRSNRRTDGFTNADKEIGYQGVRKGDLVIHAMDAFAGAIGVSDSDGKCSPVYSCCIPLSHVDTNYYARLVRTMSNTGFIQSLAKGIRERSTDFRWSDFRALHLPVPPLAEQKAIATFLDRETQRIDSLIEEKQTFIKLLKEKRQALISHVVTKGLNPDVEMQDSGIEWIGQVPKHWEKCRVKQVSSFITSGPRGWSDFISDNGNAIFLQSGDLNNELGLNLAKAKKVSPPDGAEGQRTQLQLDDVVVCITGANTGRVALVKELDSTVYINQHLSLIRPIGEKVRPKYLAYFLSSEAGSRYYALEQYGLKEGLSLKNIAETPLMLPPVSEQTSIEKYLDKALATLSSLVTSVEESIHLLKEHRTSLISAAVTGKIDVREAV
ncbi:restriction endonuclease subunit S [Vibrio vulnificus]|uniref:restriction endonuclease subunit S n=1 Tax=Vibrio vulnificus TaxID=672 RepID=UPI001A231F5D|nr:restriction endonuclease subunit S [Vibrio vulnificus]ELU0080398.1 restriction endonuclease subunit S [Vibrio vulnificus]ELV8712071.1 restriction endonuclease subunit S [Vibrio vulnificus]HAT8533553.1 restriction endonuclease subunit S [Vibrio vulnificus]HDY7914502.1 restriction endonuclease subunit S [Vibrio vulnificus]